MPAEYLNPIVGGDVRDPAAPLLRVLSLGAGVQSTTLALLAAAGQFDQPDAAIFADTGWEPAAVYRHLDELEGLLPFPVHRVSAGSLRERLLALPDETDRDRKRFAAVPFFTADGGMGVRQCTKAYKLYPIRDKIKELSLIKGARCCEECGATSGIEIDHRDSLGAAARSGSWRRLIRAYTYGNLRRLCRECHTAKTRRDRREQAALASPQMLLPGLEHGA